MLLFYPSMSLSSQRELRLICGLTQEGFVGSSAVQLLEEGSFTVAACWQLMENSQLLLLGRLAVN